MGVGSVITLNGLTTIIDAYNTEATRRSLATISYPSAHSIIDDNSTNSPYAIVSGITTAKTVHCYCEGDGSIETHSGGTDIIQTTVLSHYGTGSLITNAHQYLVEFDISNLASQCSCDTNACSCDTNCAVVCSCNTQCSCNADVCNCNTNCAVVCSCNTQCSCNTNTCTCNTNCSVVCSCNTQCSCNTYCSCVGNRFSDPGSHCFCQSVCSSVCTTNYTCTCDYVCTCESVCTSVCTTNYTCTCDNQCPCESVCTSVCTTDYTCICDKVCNCEFN